jgi:hypothetical protein
MLPSATGTALANSWTAGTSQTVTFNVAVPSYVYDKKQLAVVAFIQNNTNKEVLQSGLSSPLPLPLDASIKVCGATEITCNSAFTPAVEVTNFGQNDITSLDFSYTIGSTNSTYNWTGNLASGASTTISFPGITLSTPTSTFTANITAVNGGSDLVSGNNTFSKSILYNSSSAVAAPVVQDFVATAFPPANWYNQNGGATAATWSRSPVGATAANGSAKMDFYNSPDGDVDELLTTKFDLTTANQPTLTFKLAKAGYQGYSDQLDVDVSTDCGATWTNVWSKSDPALLTAGNLGSAFTATSGSATQWRQETISLASFVGQGEVIARFKAISGFGNNLYLDDINLTTTVGINENQLEEQISIFPTPTTGTVFLNLSVIRDEQVRISILDATGKQLDTYMTEKSNQHEVQLGGLANGLYSIQIDADGQRLIKRVVLNK